MDSSGELLFVTLVVSSLLVVCGGKLNNAFDISWGDGRGKIFNSENLLTLSLDQYSGSGFQSKNEYFFGKINIQIKLVYGNSAGTVTTYYLSSKGANHDEIDFEFLGNLSGQPYIVHTNLFIQGQGNREQQFYLWFDPTTNFHTYSVLWNPKLVAWYVDGTPIRVFRNMESSGLPFPKSQAMRTYGSIWNADDWATQGGRIKTNWTYAPFTASFANFKANACIWSSASAASSCTNSTASSSANSWLYQEVDSTSQARLKWVQNNYMVYNYCDDTSRFPQGLPPECTATNTS